MSRYEPTESMLAFAKEAIRINALNKTGLSTQADIDRLERLGNTAQSDQHEANKRRDESP